ncbi:hypothetical protein WMY93_004053 [Mugilogobius chulae]|uniref:BED-type domain-containing protein n=1 Tax=Mugilogobius chulae TaxID=88201 RepID=A0AAW0PMN8_9GOBI
MEQNEIQPAPLSLKAGIWTHFGFYNLPGTSQLDMRTIICKNCKSKLKYFGNTTNARAHLARHHPELKEAEKRPKPPDQRTLDECSRFPVNSSRAGKISHSIACFIAKDLRPYSTVEGEGFRFMMKTLESRCAIPSRSYFSEKAVPQLYEETKSKVETDLRKATRVALTCDSWTSRATQSFVTFTAHFITNKWQMQSCVLQTRVMSDSHTAANINAVFHNVAEEWSLNLNDVVFVTDNAANMLAAAQMEDITHITCFAHSLNLAAQRALKLNAVARLMGRIRRICTFFHRSPLASRVLQEKQRLLGLPPHKLKSDVATRWNSCYEMLERFLEQQPAICAALLSPQVRRCGSSTDISTLNEADVTNAEEIAQALKPMRDATHIMSEDSTPTLSVVAPLHAQMLNDTLPDCSDSPVIHEIKQAINGDLSKRYTSEHSKRLLYTASTLDPRFKTLPFLTEEQREEIHERVLEEATQEVGENSDEADVRQEDVEQLLPREDEASAPKRKTALLDLLGKTFTEVSVPHKSTTISSEEELKKYLAVPSLPLSEDPLEWWRFNEGNFPLLSRQAKRYLCIPGTSVAAERVFSTAGDISVWQLLDVTRLNCTDRFHL